jgi:uncharacterized protein (DUF433 family)
MIWKDIIISDKEILLGKPIIKGTRISVELIIELFENGWNEEMILKNYPHISHYQIQAVFSYLKDCMQNEFLFALDKTA